jgi:plastocyanin domain-containing protein
LDREVPSASTQARDALPGDPLQPNPAKNGVQEIAIIAGDLGFFPKKIFVNRDMPVRLFVTGASRKNLCVLIDAFQVRRQVKSQKVEEVSFTPGTPGTFRMHCPINGIEGTLVVRELPAATQLAGGPGLTAPRMGAGE